MEEVKVFLESLCKIPTLSLEEASLERVKQALDKEGVVFIEDIVSNNYVEDTYIPSVTKELAEFLDCNSNDLFTKDKSTNFVGLSKLSCLWNSKNGLGNSSFRYFYPQFLKDCYNTDLFGDNSKVYFEYNPMHKHNLRLLNQTGLFPILSGLHKGNCIVSWDSTKIRCTAKGSTAPKLTPIHCDIYNIDRVQAIITLKHKSVALGFIPRTNSSEFVKLVSKIEGKSKSKFASYKNKNLCTLLTKYLQYPNPSKNCIAIWREGLVHAEVPIKLTPGHKARNIAIRAVVGTNSIELEDSILRKLAILSENSFLPAVYNNKNKDNAIDKYTVNKKVTRWRKPREPKPFEKELFNKACSELELNLDKSILAMYGLH